MHLRPSLVRYTQHVSYHPMDLTSNARSQLSMQELSDHIRTVFPITKTTSGIEPKLTDHETVVLPLHYIAWQIIIMAF